MLRYEVCFHPSWWHKNAQINFDRSFWYDAEARIQSDVVMRRTLFQKFGKYGIGEENPLPRPIVGSDFTACGFLFSEMLGCPVLYSSDNSPQVACANLDDDACFALQIPDFDKNDLWQSIESQLRELKTRYGYVECHMNLMGVQNIALDLRGQTLFCDYYDETSPAEHLLDVICGTLLEGSRRMHLYTDALSSGVTNIVRHICPEVFVTSNCTVEMVSQQIYEEFLLKHDIRLAEAFPPFGIHHCGKTMEHVVEGYSKVPHLKFVEVGAFSDLAAVARALPGDILINARYSPVRLMTVCEQDLYNELKEMTRIVPGSRLSISCVGIDSTVPDDRVQMFLEICKKLL